MKDTNLFDLSGKVAIVTGAAGLLGTHHCDALIEAGAIVIATDLINIKRKTLAQKLAHNYYFMQADITDASSVTKLTQKIIKQFGRIDILINNAAINDKFEDPAAALEQSRFEHFPLELWRRALDVNLTGTFICSQIIGTKMAEKKHGSIINIASTYGLVAPDQSLYRTAEGEQKFYKTPSYSVTKGAIISFTRFLAAYWGEVGVRVNCLSPGGVYDNQEQFFVENYSRRTPLKRMALPTDYKGAIIFLASDASSYMTGANLVMDGGFTIW